MFQRTRDGDRTHAVLRSYLPGLVFLLLGTTVGAVFGLLNNVVGPRRHIAQKTDPYECGLPSEIRQGFRFGISFYLIAMLFILFDIEVIFLYPIGVILKDADSVFVLGEMVTFVVLLLVAFVYVWRKGALDWR